MPSRILVTQARQVFEDFPALVEEIDLQPGDEPPLEFARALLERAERFEAIVYCAFLLPRREAVWWGCLCLRALGAQADAALLAAEAWVRKPDDATRRAALSLSASGPSRKASTWIALAAGQSGGSIAAEDAHPVPAPAQMTGVGVKAAVILAIAQSPAPGQRAWIGACVEAALRFADGGEGKVLPPAASAAKPGAA